MNCYPGTWQHQLMDLLSFTNTATTVVANLLRWLSCRQVVSDGRQTAVILV